jgi:hypothetical protein
MIFSHDWNIPNFRHKRALLRSRIGYHSTMNRITPPPTKCGFRISLYASFIRPPCSSSELERSPIMISLIAVSYLHNILHEVNNWVLGAEVGKE